MLQEKIFGFNVYIDKKFYYLSTHERQEKYYPKIGDYRIQYSYIPMLDSISIVGEQEGNTIKAYKDKVLLVNKGRIPIDTIFEALFSGQKSL